ncbi:MAG: hypothetical protein ABS35_44830 [Kaistia sp. SCN 65-12]|nr:MAG: hypothetical protein ABS35_44830 [Kaistia sp. SCN 65-12]
MKTILSALALAAALGVAGNVAAEDAMATPMAGDAMAAEPMAGDAMMSPEDMLKACLDKAAMEADAMKKDEATKACNATQPMAGDAMSATPGDAMSAEPMADGAMKPAQ